MSYPAKDKMTEVEAANKWWFFGEEKTKEALERKVEAMKRFLRAMTKAEVNNIGKRLQTLDELSKLKAQSKEQKQKKTRQQLDAEYRFQMAIKRAEAKKGYRQTEAQARWQRALERAANRKSGRYTTYWTGK